MRDHADRSARLRSPPVILLPATSTTSNGETSLQPVRLDLDVALEQSNARLRLAAAILAGAAGIWLAWVEHAVWLRLTALASAAFAARWIMNFRTYRSNARIAHHAGTAPTHFLEITTQCVTLASGAQRRELAFSRVVRIELDQDRLAVVLCLSGEPDEPDRPDRKDGQSHHSGQGASSTRYTGSTSAVEEVMIEPVYGGLGLHELGATLQRYLSAHRDSARSFQSS